MSLLKLTTFSFLLIFSNLVFSAEDIPPPPSIETTKSLKDNNAATPPPSLPDEADDSRNIPEPEVRIIKNQDSVIEEYRTHGRLRYVKITPRGGVPYYMVDTDGDGILENWDKTRGNPPINRWILLEW